MKREDRPHESKPKKKLAEGAAPPPVCSECAFVFTEEAVKRGARLKKRRDGTVRCQEDKACRSRSLTTTLGRELESAPPENWLYLKYPRDRVKAEMDVRPKNWNETGWKARYPLADRVMACILYHSWCWPVSLPFAVQLHGTLPHPARRDFDDDEILVDQYKQPRPLRLVDIAVVLNEHKNNVWTRGIKRRVDTKDLRLDEDGVFYPAAKLLDMTIEERRALYLPDHLETAPGDELRGVPKRYRKELARIEANCPQYISEDIRTDIFRGVHQWCSSFNDGLRVLRTERDAGIEQECLRGTTLLPALETRPRTKPSVSPRASNNTPAVMDAAASVPSRGVGQSAVQPPHRSVDPFSGVVDAGKGALGKLDRPRTRTQTDRPSGADNPFTPRIREWLESAFSELPTSLEDRELDQIAATIHSEQHLEQFQIAAKRQKDPRGWKVFVRIAVECQKHHAKYKASGSKEESYVERRAREIAAEKKGKG